VRSDFVQYWNQITPENEGRWPVVERDRDEYNWDPLDRVYQYAKQNGILFKQHTLIWGATHNTWLGLPSAEIAVEIEEWIRDFCNRYPDTHMIDVVNEALPGHQPAYYARNAFGSDWIKRSFQLARQYCPNSVLILNDYNVIRWETEEFIEMAKPVIQSGYVDAIGLEAHGLEGFPAADIQQKLDFLWQQLQVPIYISQYDVALIDDAEQLQHYQEQFPVFYNHPHVKGITIWGYVVGKTWREGTGLIRQDGTHRPAMTWLMNYLQQHPK
jgi:GH35 family endo-1,4-beta-xylanase